MRTNLELKAHYPSAARAARLCVHCGAHPQGVLRQTDTYFRIQGGRLKLREINDREFELIYYRRKNRQGRRYSEFVVVPLKDANPMRDVCAAIFGVRVVVRKKRLLFLYRNARIHIDSVQGLGTFIEFEVIVNRGRKQAGQLMTFLISEFGIRSKEMIGGSYADMLARRPKRPVR